MISLTVDDTPVTKLSRQAIVQTEEEEVFHPSDHTINTITKLNYQATIWIEEKEEALDTDKAITISDEINSNGSNYEDSSSEEITEDELSQCIYSWKLEVYIMNHIVNNERLELTHLCILWPNINYCRYW